MAKIAGLWEVLVMTYEGHRDQRWGHISYAQHGDDFMLLNIFELIGMPVGIYMDLGAHHPETISNTQLLYNRGWRGVNIDANASLIAEFQRKRPGDVNICIGVGPVAGEGVLYKYSETSGCNTLSEEEVKRLSHMGPILSQEKVAIKTLTQLVDEYCRGTYPDLLCLDIEGYDYAVLKTMKVGISKPKVICVETRLHDTVQMKEMLEDKQYFLYCRMGENLFFIDDRYRHIFR